MQLAGFFEFEAAAAVAADAAEGRVPGAVADQLVAAARAVEGIGAGAADDAVGERRADHVLDRGQLVVAVAAGDALPEVDVDPAAAEDLPARPGDREGRGVVAPGPPSIVSLP